MIRTLPVTLALSVLAGTASAQINSWTNTGVGDWTNAANWSLWVPTTEHQIRISNGGTAELTGITTPSLLNVFLGVQSNTQGHLRLDNATLYGGHVQVGSTAIGTLHIENGSAVHASSFTCGASGSGALGATTLFDGSVTTSSNFFVANSGTGSYFSQQTGTVTVGNSLVIGGNAGSDGTYTIGDGLLDVDSNISIGNVGSGHLGQTGGTVLAQTMTLGNSASGLGTYEMLGGTLEVSLHMNVCWLGQASFVQQGGSVTTNTLRIGWFGNGEYRLVGGLLDANKIIRNTGTLLFAMTGGRLTFNEFGSITDDFDLVCDGGTLAPGDQGIDDALVWGDFTLEAPAVLEMHLAGVNPATEADLLDVRGSVTLAGSLGAKLEYIPEPGDCIRLIDNDGTDPVIGQFGGLPEGSILQLLDPDNKPRDFRITYRLGCNDVALIADHCPADLTGSSDPNHVSYGKPDGDADGDDFFYYLDAFDNTDLKSCDLTGSSDPNDSSYGIPDCDCDGDDFFYFLDLFDAGCP